MEHRDKGIFVAEGEKVVCRLLESSIEVISILATPEWIEKLGAGGHPTSRAGAIYRAKKELVETIVGANLHQGIMAIGKIPPELPLETVIRGLPKPFLAVALDGLVHAENVGVVVRNCAGFGVDAVIVGESSSSPYLRRAVRNSMGTVFKQTVIHTEDLAASLSLLHAKYETTVIAADPRGEIVPDERDFSRNVCLVFGSEGEGLSDRVLSLCQKRFAIPMSNNVDSLNVASASAVVLYETQKQRGKI